MVNEELEIARNMTGREFCNWLLTNRSNYVYKTSTGVFLSNSVVSGRADTSVDKHSSVFCHNQSNKKALFYRFSSGDSGDAIACLQNYFGLDFVDSVRALSGRNVKFKNPKVDYFKENETKIIKEIEFPAKRETMYHGANYLLNRGINADTLRMLVDSGKIYETEEGKFTNLVFINDEKTFCEKKATLGNFRMLLPGTQLGSFWDFAYREDPKQVKNVYLCEAVIDAISLHDLMHEKYENVYSSAYISMAGLKHSVIASVQEKYPNADIILAVDNDKAGDKFCERNNEYKRIVPKLKDWNDDLIEYNKHKYDGVGDIMSRMSKIEHVKTPEYSDEDRAFERWMKERGISSFSELGQRLNNQYKIECYDKKTGEVFKYNPSVDIGRGRKRVETQKAAKTQEENLVNKEKSLEGKHIR